MTNSDVKVKERPQNQEDIITINIQPFLVPISILLSAIMMTVSISLGFNHLANVWEEKEITSSVNTTANTASTTTQGDTAATTVDIDRVKALFTNDSLVFGDVNSGNLLVEFSDPSCPYCHIASGKNPSLNSDAGGQFLLVADGGSYVAPVIEFKRLVDEGKAAYVWKYTNGHGNGQLGSQAFYCANEQGKFWEVHDAIMTAEGYDLLNENVKNDVSKANVLADFLKDYVDEGALENCIKSEKYASALTRDSSEGTAIGVQGTPGFFVNESIFRGAYSFTSMESALI